jgi:hypothetical protein
MDELTPIKVGNYSRVVIVTEDDTQKKRPIEAGDNALVVITDTAEEAVDIIDALAEERYH